MPDQAASTTIGFVGLGSMGSAMVGNLLDHGIDVVVWNRSPEPLERLVERGARAASSLGEVFQAGVVLSMLSNESVVFDLFSDDVLAAAPEGAIHVDMATIGAGAAQRLIERHRAAGVGYVAAPVLGRPPVAAAGQVTVLAAGEPGAMAAVRPLLEIVGRRVWDFGDDPSSANLVKIGVNFLIIHALQAMSESVALLERRGVDTSTFVEVLGDSLFPGPVYSGYGAMIAEQRYEPALFTTELGFKDLMLAVDAARAAEVVLPSESVLRGVFEDALSNGQEQLDWASIAEVTRRRSR
ncbi:NAD(P)-dependent oxidoreductase [Cnuibacter physcomitrellae]|uniref:NAD(P)-dependent oxidoreductase n=1 Tax=Cnuibacter physcomitrellae TaxID=1619308 RepID=UPI00217611A5|nr:NAD(P)-dependent oxidoreductase [Cnuibacter physcomitrellae]MCS5497694.1 NAD(P)-dependent oxidoreductase [Cnuibacter physcomitrellae]